MKIRSKTMRRFLIIFFVLILFVLALEVLLRFRENHHRFLTNTSCMQVAGDYHHQYKKNCDATAIYYGKQVQFHYNEFGLRDRPFVDLNPKKMKVLVIGDSNAEGWGIDVEQSIPRRLEALFDNEVEFVNASMRFSGPILQSLRLQELIPIYKPAAVLWLLTEKDYGYDHFADALATKRDEKGFPINFSSEDVVPFALFLHKIQSYIGKSYIFEFVSQALIIKQIESIQARQLPDFNPCRGVDHLLSIAAEKNIPVLPVLMPIGPDYYFEQDIKFFPSLWACIQSASPVPARDARTPKLQAKELMLPNNSHFNPEGAQIFSNELAPVVKNFLRENKIPLYKEKSE